MMSFRKTGWIAFEPEADMAAWVEFAAPVAVNIAQESQHQNAWLRHGNTWFVGVNILPNDVAGTLPGGPPLQGTAMDWIAQTYGQLPLDAAQVSINYPGYPLQDPDESDANHRFRLKRDAAHVDGLLPMGPDRRRYLKEPHAYVLGIPLTQADARASPMVIWEGSHIIMGDFFRQVCSDATDISQIDLTDVYHAARRRCFDECPRRVVHVPIGGAYVLHRHALHGVAPWAAGAKADPDGRAIAYFRPEFPNGAGDWL